MINRILDFLRKEARHVYVKKLEQKLAELEYDIGLLLPVHQKNDIFWIQLQEKQKLYSQLEFRLRSKKQEWHL